MKRIFIILVIPILYFTFLNAQVRFSNNPPLIDIEVEYDSINGIVNFSVLNKEGTTIFINDNASFARNGSKIYITLLDSEQSDNVVGTMNIYGLSKTASTIELDEGKIHEYSYDIREQISSHQTFNRIRVEYELQYHIIKNKIHEVKLLKGREFIYK